MGRKCRRLGVATAMLAALVACALMLFAAPVYAEETGTEIEVPPPIVLEGDGFTVTIDSGTITVTIEGEDGAEDIVIPVEGDNHGAYVSAVAKALEKGKGSQHGAIVSLVARSNAGKKMATDPTTTPTDPTTPTDTTDTTTPTDPTTPGDPATPQEPTTTTTTVPGGGQEPVVTQTSGGAPVAEELQAPSGPGSSGKDKGKPEGNGKPDKAEKSNGNNNGKSDAAGQQGNSGKPAKDKK